MQAVLVVIAVIFAPLLIVMISLLEQLAKLVHLEQLLDDFSQRMQLGPLAPDAQPTELLAIFPPWVQTLIHAFFALLPVLLIIGLILLVRRRARRAKPADEERESLWSWGGLADDLRGLFAGRRRASLDTGLRAALARLRGDDPASRVRRSYIRLLLLGQERSQPRGETQTPREYAPAAGALLPDTAAHVERLTAAYERARYFPNGTSEKQAAASEHDWAAIEQAERRAKPPS